MVATVSSDRVVGLFEAGVAAVEAQAADRDDTWWDEPACGAWSAADVTRHVRAVIGWYQHWLDRAETGQTDMPFPAGELARRNDEELAGLRTLSGAAATREFAEQARHYLTRVQADWDRRYGYPFGTVTAGLHAGVAATEWHLHAWDLSGGRHQPADPTGLYLAAGACFTRAEGGVKGTVLGWLVPLGARRRPWDALLKRSGRTPI